MSEAFKSTGDSETDEVLRQMAEEGLAMPEFAKVAEEQETVKEEAEEQAEEIVEEDETEEEEEEEEKSPRSVPVQKYEYEKEKRKKAEALVKELQNQPKKVEVDDEIKKFAEEQNLDIDAAYKLVDLVSKRAIPDDLRAEIEEGKKQREDKKMWEGQYQQFDDEFSRSLVPVVKRDNPQMTDKDIQKLAEQMRDTAFEPKNASKSLVEIYFAMSDSDKKKSRVAGESNKVHSIPKNTPLEEITAEQISDMSEKEFEEYSNALASKSPKLTR
jgi:hypothetical protein